MLARAPRSLVHLLVVVVAVFASSVALAPTSDAMTRQTRHHLLDVAASKKGAPYRYGADGPRRFDCSGYTTWVFAHVGRHLPRTSRAQARYARHVRKVNRRPGDLVFFRSNGRVYHVGIYAGRNTIWHAPRPGRRVGRDHIWTRSVTYGRVR